MLLSEIPFASYFAYTSRPATDEAREARNFVIGQLKNDRVARDVGVATSQAIVRQLTADLPGLPFADWFTKDVALIAAPRSSLQQPGQLWVPRRIIEAMSMAGLGYVPASELRRASAVRKAAYAQFEDRPVAADHFASLVFERELEAIERIVIVDDVVTTGSTLLGAASRIHEALPSVDVRGFAIVRAVRQGDFRQLADPCIGTIKLWPSGRTYREP